MRYAVAGYGVFTCTIGGVSSSRRKAEQLLAGARARRGAKAQTWPSIHGAHIQQVGEVDAVVIVLAQHESALVGRDALVKAIGKPLEIPQLFVNRSPKAQCLRIIGRVGRKPNQDRVRILGLSGLGCLDL